MHTVYEKCINKTCYNIGDMMIEKFLIDRKNIIEDSKRSKNILDVQKIINNIKEEKNTEKIVIDFTEYNPLHNGHKYCLDFGKNHGIFISVIPGPLERSGRGVPYLVDRHVRAEMAVRAGADIVVEGPPMGIMGSGQYMQCLIKMFYSLNGDIIPRGYIKEGIMEKVINSINSKNHIKIKPYNISCIESGEKLGEKLEIDNYVIASMSYTMYKLKEKLKNWGPEFKFIERIEGISGTKIRQGVMSGNFDSIKHMLPETTLEIFKSFGTDILDFVLERNEHRVLETVNSHNLEDYVSKNIAERLNEKEHYNSISEVKLQIPIGFSKNHIERTISKLEARIDRDTVSRYIENYPSKIRILKIKE
ncbi:protein of unknown function DUF795 [Methanococcus vannielii SB]|uniref:Putative cytidyltransferase-related C-terminal region domain-containing protein n=2 Tax=Methanococcus vannielii TaxID=2187 RepID=A6UQB5_METVS|nr:protein of unknown function DUF795 [Methanococcus vannielii SB]